VASAAQPAKSTFTFSDTNPLVGVCPFDVTVDSDVTAVVATATFSYVVASRMPLRWWGVTA